MNPTENERTSLKLILGVTIFSSFYKRPRLVRADGSSVRYNVFSREILTLAAGVMCATSGWADSWTAAMNIASKANPAFRALLRVAVSILAPIMVAVFIYHWSGIY